jgi:hypothetical protein
MRMDERNLYAPPKAVVADAKEANCTRDGKFVIVLAGSDLPERCIVCNAAAEMPIKKTKVYWHTPWLYLLILLNILLYVIVGVLARKSFEVSAGLCEQHAYIRRRRVGGLLAAGVAALSAGAVMMKLDQQAGAIIAFCAAVLLFIAAMFAARKVYPTKITKEYARLAGCKEPFLASLE